MNSRRLGLAAASLLGAATFFGAAPAGAGELVCPERDCVPGQPGPGPERGLGNAMGKLDIVLHKWQPESTPFIKIDYAMGKINGVFEDLMHKGG